MASDLLTVEINGSLSQLQDLLRTHQFYQPGTPSPSPPSAIPGNDEQYTFPATLGRHQYDELKKNGILVNIQFNGVPPDRRAEVTVGKGDRFKGGECFPQGLGSRSDGRTHDLGGIMNVDEIGSAIKGLVKEYGMLTFSTPHSTAEGSIGLGGLVGQTTADPGLYHLFFSAAAHSNERGAPDNIIYFISDLLYARKHGTGLTYGARSYSNADVLRALSIGIIFFPLINPDGVRWDQATDSQWRKNRNPASAIAGNDLSIGIDVNRNYDFLWDYRRYFDPSLTGPDSNVSSDDPTSGKFHGTKAFSEPEALNVKWVLDTFPSIRWFMDIHSAKGVILYSWGDDDDQCQDSNQNFLNPAYDGKRGVLGDDIYKEYINEADLNIVRGVATRTASAMVSVGGRKYGPEQAVGFYPTSGSSDDYSFSRSQVDSSLNKIYGFMMEFGYETNFYPTLEEFQHSVMDTAAGFMEFCLAAADIGLV